MSTTLPKLLFTADEVAADLDLSMAKVKRLIESGDIISVKIGGQRRIRRTDLDACRSTLGRRKPRDPRVYFIQATDGGPIKIGTAVDVTKRVAGLQIGSPVALRVLATIPGGRALEKQLHERFTHHRVRGEWFSPHPDLMAFIAKNARAA